MSEADIPKGINDIDPAVFNRVEEKVRPRKKPKELAPQGTVSITSLMDALTIILVFLIKSFSSNPVTLKQAKDLKMPYSTATEEPPFATAVMINMSSIIVEDSLCATFDNGKPAESDLTQGGMMIEPCFGKLQDQVEHQRKIGRMQKKADGGFDGQVVFIVDRNVPYDLITKVMYTAGQAQYSKFRFAVVKGGKG